MRLINFLILVFLISLFGGPAVGNELGEENPLVADTFTKKKHIRYFGEYETVVMNYLEGGDFQLSAAAGFTSTKVVADSTSASPTVYKIETSATKWLAGASAKYGISDQLSAGVQVTYVQGNTDDTNTVSGVPSSSSYKTTGIQDLNLRGQFALALNSFGYLAEIQYRPAIGKSSYNAATDESNAYREQSALGIENHLILKTNKVKWGGILGYQYAFLGEDEQISSAGVSTTREVSGGNVLTATGFVEFERFFDSNLQLSYQRQEPKSSVSPAGSTTDLPALDYLSLLATAKINISRKVSLIPQFQYATLLNRNVDEQFTYSQVDLFGVAAEIRMLF